MSFHIEQCWSGCKYFDGQLIEVAGQGDRAQFGCKLCAVGGVKHLTWDPTTYNPEWYNKWQDGQLFQVKRQCLFPTEYPAREDTW